MAMRRAQIIVLAITLAAGGAAFYLASRGPAEAPAPVQEAAPQARTIDVLVAAVDVPTGRTLGAADVKWQAWPADFAPTGVIKRAETPNGAEEVAGSIVRYGFIAGEPIRKDKIIKADGSGFMAAILPAGMRAVAITIDTRGATSAGNFILPNDRVDVLRTFRDDESTRTQGIDVFVSETILSNIRVLAIGQNVQEKNGERIVIGETATLELDPRQAELVTLAQKVGQLSLALRSIADATQQGEVLRPDTSDSGLTIVRYGISKQMPKR
jgi:pilus assembly protein CpaB